MDVLPRPLDPVSAGLLALVAELERWAPRDGPGNIPQPLVVELPPG